jgi:hypothetical protein
MKTRLKDVPSQLSKEILVKDGAVDLENYRVRVVVSDGTIDRDEEIIVPESFEKWLPTYRQNPILCWGHPLSAWGERRPPEDCIGKALEIGLVNRQLVATFQYAVKENETAAQVWALVAGGYLRSYSVGVIPHQYVAWWDDMESINALPEEYRSAILEGRAWAVYTESELVEISQCYVGSNRSALVRAVHDGAIPLARAKSWAPGLVVPRYWAGADLRKQADPPPEPPTPQPNSEQKEPENPAPSLSEDEEFEQFLEESPDAVALLLSLLD